MLDPSILGSTIGNPATSVHALSRNAFRRALPGDDNRLVGRNTFYGDGVRNVDAGLTKNVSLRTHDRVMLRVEVYNRFNRRQWSFPNNDFASSGFGQITGQFNGARSVQVQVRY